MSEAHCRVVVVEDHPLVRRALMATLRQAGLDVVGEAFEGGSAIDLVCREQPDVVLMDVELPIVSGLTATRELAHVVPEAAVLVLTMHDDPATISAAMAAGARGFVSKTEDTEVLLGAIAAVSAGESVWPRRHDPNLDAGIPGARPSGGDGWQ